MMKQVKVPRTITIDHLNMSGPKKVGLFRRKLVCDYDSPNGVVREFQRPGKTVGYKLLKTGEEVNVNFSFSAIADMDGYFMRDLSND